MHGVLSRTAFGRLLSMGRQLGDASRLTHAIDRRLLTSMRMGKKLEHVGLTPRMQEYLPI